IGLAADGLQRLPNDGDGVSISEGASGNVVGGQDGHGNVISGNQNFGISLLEASENVVEGNLIGTDPTGARAIGNVAGILVRGSLGDAANNRIVENVISGNAFSGVEIVIHRSTGTIVQGNFIGVAADGITPLGNGEFGLRIGGDAG